MNAPLTIAHLSDVHLAPLTGFWPQHWNTKRFLGYANWRLKRRKSHLRSVVDRLVADLKLQRVDHIVVTGDLVNIGLPGEYAAARIWLENLGTPDRVSVVPGNHDVYCRLRTDPGIARWAEYMASDDSGAQAAPGSGPHFPYVRRVGDIALIGLNSAVVTPPGVASGALGRPQVEAAARLLRELGRERLFRLVLIHHPPLVGHALPMRELRDAADFESVLEKEGAELVVHGHNHRDAIVWKTGAKKPIPVVGIASGSIGRHLHHEALARYNLYKVIDAGEGWRIELTGRGIRHGDGPVVDVEHRVLEEPATLSQTG